ncbi:MAG: haloacid dehalogenase type II [Verrucomicrobiota bacterium]
MGVAEETKVLAFDVFGTVVDWYSTVVREVEAWALSVEASEFALAWRAGYRPAMDRVASGELAWKRIDELHRMILIDLLEQNGITHLNEGEIDCLNRVWHRLDPWPDAVEGLTRLKERYLICTLSNGNLGLLANMAKHAGLPWDCILSAELFRAYKPDPVTYLGVADTFDVEPGEVMLAAAHHGDLAAARACGLKTAYIERPAEFGPANVKEVSSRPENTLHAKDIIDLASMLNC